LCLATVQSALELFNGELDWSHFA